MNTPETLSLETDANFTLSWELLALFTLIVKHATPELRRTIIAALKGADNAQIGSTWRLEQMSIDEAQEGITDFFQMLEQMLHEVTDERITQRARERKILGTVEHIDPTILDDEELQSSIKTATERIDRNPQANAKELFMRELLRNWKPGSKKNAS